MRGGKIFEPDLSRRVVVVREAGSFMYHEHREGSKNSTSGMAPEPNRDPGLQKGAVTEGPQPLSAIERPEEQIRNTSGVSADQTSSGFREFAAVEGGSGPNGSSMPGQGAQIMGDQGQSAEINAAGTQTANPAKGKWMTFAFGSAVILTLLTIAGVVLVTRPTSTVDQLLILTVPSGAEVTFDSKFLGRSPVKLEGVRIGSHQLEITKDGYQGIDGPITVSKSDSPLDFKLNPIPPEDAKNWSKEERIKKYQTGAEDAFARGDYAIPADGRTALYYTEMLLSEDGANQFGNEMWDRIRKVLLQQALSALSHGDLGQAQELVDVLQEEYPGDEAHALAAKLEAQLAIHRGDLRELVRKAEESLSAGKLIDPPGASAWYYAKQALALDRQNQQAKAVYNKVREDVGASIDNAIQRDDLDGANKQLEQVIRLFPRDKQLIALQQRLDDRRTQVQPKTDEAASHRLRGLTSESKGEFALAIPDLEYAVAHGRATPDVLFALGHSCYETHAFETAASYLKQLPSTAGAAYVSGLALLGEIQEREGDLSAALQYYNQARDLGGSTMYQVIRLDDKIDRIEKRQHAAAIQPSTYSIQVRHIHGGLLHGSCTGTLRVEETGVRYDAANGEHTFSSSITGTEISMGNDELSVKFMDRTEKFKVSHPEGEKLRQALIKFQTYYSANK
jgi:tetratricopeptide (TPR) repeat protein